MLTLNRRFLLGSAAALIIASSSTAALAADKILASVPGLSFPFFVHMMNAFKAEIQKQGYEVIESDGQVSSPKQTADIEAAITQGVKGIVISPNEVDAMAPALQQAVEANIPVVTVDRRVPSVEGILAHVGADNVKGGEAQGNLILSLYPDGATIINLQGQSGAVWDETSPQNGRFQAMLMRSPATRIEGGSDEILRNIIAERVLGLAKSY